MKGLNSTNKRIDAMFCEDDINETQTPFNFRINISWKTTNQIKKSNKRKKISIENIKYYGNKQGKGQKTKRVISLPLHFILSICCCSFN